MRVPKAAWIVPLCALVLVLVPGRGVMGEEDSERFNTEIYESPWAGEAPSKGTFSVHHEGEGEPPKEGYFREHEVGEIAAAFGWSEAEIMAMSEARRTTYLDIARGGP